MEAYLFDVDGVLTNTQTPDVINPEFTLFLITYLQQGIPLGFISGRGMLWLRSKFIKVLEKYVNEHKTLNKNILDLLYVSGEFGVVTACHIDGQRTEKVDKAFIIPSEIKNALMIHAQEFSDYVFVETEKQTIFTLRANLDVDFDVFQEHKKEIVASFEEVLKTHPEIEVQTDRIAINIRYRRANKKYATDKYLEWLSEKKYIPEKFIVFGDSPTDLEMGEELQRQQKHFEFIYVGEQSELQTQRSFPITFTKGHCDEGTLEYLKTHGDS
ncbi:MAG TPA: trehalose-phosphatase [Candidatus Acidoferrales bacterium]|nr:trehalose-phosphatase [Candidatus Acidoferrales bacterium]